MEKFTHCVKCGAEKTGGLECPSCGAIYAKAERLYKEPPPKVQPCPACCQTVSVNAESCPHCGEPKPKEALHSQPDKNPNVGPKTVIAALIFCALILSSLFNGTSKSPAKQDLSSLAGIHCQEFVKRQLKAPATADFPFLGESISKIDNSTYQVRSYVDAQNSFGATIRTNWTCKIQYKSGDKYDTANWTLIDFSL